MIRSSLLACACAAFLCALPNHAHAGDAPSSLKVAIPPVAMPPAVAKRLSLDGVALAAALGTQVSSATGHSVVALPASPCMDAGCALEAAKGAGADLLLRTEIALVGQDAMVNASLILVQEARVVQVVSKAVPSGELAAAGLGFLVGPLFKGEVLAASPTAPPTVVERMLIVGGAWAQEAGDEGARRNAISRAAQVVAASRRFNVVSQDEVASVLKSQADQQALGEGDPQAFTKVADALKARFLLTLDVGRAGGVTTVGGTLLDATTAEVVGRSSVTLAKPSQIMDAVEVVVRKILGESVTLPAPDADPNNVEAQLRTLGNAAAAAYQGLPQGGANGLVLIPLADLSDDARSRKLGAQLTAFMHHLMGTTPPSTVAAPDKLKELSKAHNLANPLSLPAASISEVGSFLGAQALILGSVGDVGTDFLLQVQLVKSSNGQVLWSGHALLPKARRGELLPKQATVTRSRADALVRAIIPGLAQFTGGGSGIIKGVVFVGVMAVGVLGAVGMGVAAGVVGYLGGMLWAPRVFAPGNADLLGTCDPEQGLGVAGCQAQAMPRFAVAAVLGVGVAALAVVAVGAYLLSFVDAAIFGERSEQLDFEAAQ